MTPVVQQAVNYLSRFSRTERQVANYLQRKGFSTPEISQALSYLKKHHFVDDDSFAEAYVISRIRHRDGPLKIKRLLFQKGISGESVNTLLEKHYPLDLQVKNAESLMRSRSGRSRTSRMRFVASRGFTPYVIIQALRLL